MKRVLHEAEVDQFRSVAWRQGGPTGQKKEQPLAMRPKAAETPRRKDLPRN